ncbi:IS1 family transposase [Gleimia sp. 6138-11-ORH1]|uniref:transposase-like zinc-binding domain-containing protein n=1 Tax=Gleimia sp. 6138-11-ORH1 TaxID=2973937 RepID=UPI0037BE781B
MNENLEHKLRHFRGIPNHPKTCPVCSSPMLRSGYSPNGKQRWLCRECKISSRWHYDTQTRDISAFLDFILGKVTYAEIPRQGRTFRRKPQKLIGNKNYAQSA